MISTNQFKNGKVVKVEDELYYIINFQHIKPGKGGAYVRTKLKGLRFGTVIDRTFRADEKFEEVFLEEKIFRYLYRSGDTYHFMDLANFEEIELEKDTLGECIKYLKEDGEMTASIYNGKIIGTQPPTFVELEVVETEPGIRGNTAKGGTKPATLVTGLTLQVPLFINKGDKIRVDTRTGGYAERV